jgi:hypothetical protein
MAPPFHAERRRKQLILWCQCGGTLWIYPPSFVSLHATVGDGRQDISQRKPSAIFTQSVTMKSLFFPTVTKKREASLDLTAVVQAHDATLEDVHRSSVIAVPAEANACEVLLS